MADTLPLSLTLVLAATVVLYAGTRLLWASIASVGLWRGALCGGPLILLALFTAPTSPGTAVAMLVSAAVLAITLGIGVSTIDLPVPEAEGSPALRALLPLAAVTCLVGFHGSLAWWHAGALAVVGGLTLWTADGERRTPRAATATWTAVPAVLLLGIGLYVLVWGLRTFSHAAGSAAFGPVVVLLTVPAVLLAMLGLLTAEARQHLPETPHETAVGLAAACLGIGLPLVIAVALLTPIVAEQLPAAWGVRLPVVAAATQPTTSAIVASTQPAGWPPVLMPLATWRVDSVLLVVVSMLLLPVGFGRFKIGRAEGTWLILIYLAYAAVATRVGSTTS